MYKVLLTIVILVGLTSSADAYYRYRHRNYSLDIHIRNRAYNEWRNHIKIEPRPQPYHYWNKRTPYYVPPVYRAPKLDLDIRF